MTSGEQCVMTPGTALMLLWSASSWGIHTLEVSLLTSGLNICHAIPSLYIPDMCRLEMH